MRPSFLLLVILVFLPIVGADAQKLPKESTEALLASVAEDELAAETCEKSVREAQIKEFGKPLPKIAGHCWNGCPISMPKPYYPEAAKRSRLKGVVKVSAIVDEDGKVTYAKMISGNAVFRQSALAAARASTYQRKVICGDRRIKFWWHITYNFRPGM